jgi:hypothetical protein
MIATTTLEDLWRAAAADLSLDIEAPFELVLPSGARITARVLVKGYGAERGMLLVGRYADVAHHASELLEQGFGFSVMDDPLPGHGYDREDMIEVLRDWGWVGVGEEPPEPR